MPEILPLTQLGEIAAAAIATGFAASRVVDWAP